MVTFAAFVALFGALIGGLLSGLAEAGRRTIAKRRGLGHLPVDLRRWRWPCQASRSNGGDDRGGQKSPIGLMHCHGSLAPGGMPDRRNSSPPDAPLGSGS